MQAFLHYPIEIMLVLIVAKSTLIVILVVLVVLLILVLSGSQPLVISSCPYKYHCYYHSKHSEKSS